VSCVIVLIILFCIHFIIVKFCLFFLYILFILCLYNITKHNVIHDRKAMNTYQQNSNLQFISDGVLSHLNYPLSQLLFYSITGAQTPTTKCQHWKQATKCTYYKVLRHIWIFASITLAIPFNPLVVPSIFVAAQNSTQIITAILRLVIIFCAEQVIDNVYSDSVHIKFITQTQFVGIFTICLQTKFHSPKHK
jgi:hypothetical protein